MAILAIFGHLWPSGHVRPIDCIRVEEWIEEWRLKMLRPMVAFAFATRHATCFARGAGIPLNHPFKLKVHYHHIRQFLTSHQLSADQRFI